MDARLKMAMKRKGVSVPQEASCVLCGDVLDNPYGHNPAPLAESGRCCSVCNYSKVLPTRIEMALGQTAIEQE